MIPWWTRIGRGHSFDGGAPAAQPAPQEDPMPQTPRWKVERPGRGDEYVNANHATLTEYALVLHDDPDDTGTVVKAFNHHGGWHTVAQMPPLPPPPSQG